MYQLISNGTRLSGAAGVRVKCDPSPMGLSGLFAHALQRMHVVALGVGFGADVHQLAVDHRSQLHLDQRVVDVSGDPRMRRQFDSRSGVYVTFDPAVDDARTAR